MKTSESIAEISKALATAWGTIKNPKHNQKVKVRLKSGGQYQFEYTDLGGIIDEIKPHFKENGITFMQHAFTELIENRLYVFVVTKFLHSSGEWIESKPLIFPAGNSIQDMGGQITYMKRYSLSAMLGISTEKDDDANASMGNQVEFNNKRSSAQKNNKPKNSAGDATRDQLLIKWKTASGKEDGFDEWYAKQAAQGYSNEQMNQVLTKRLIEINKKGKQ